MLVLRHALFAAVWGAALLTAAFDRTPFATDEGGQFSLVASDSRQGWGRGPDGGQTTSRQLELARWLSGCWELRSARRVTIEMWMPPDGNLMLGASRTTVGGVVREYEHLRLSTDGDVIVYTAIPSGQQEAAFRTTVLSDSNLVFENLAHDFPQRILYQRRGVDSLVARIEGPGPNGTRGVDFPMRRIPCVAP
jgi:Domain of unknown function (DUF6265)